jgi:hypothetical protein
MSPYVFKSLYWNTGSKFLFFFKMPFEDASLGTNSWALTIRKKVENNL